MSEPAAALLLRIAAAPDQPHAEAAAALNDTDWTALCDLADRERLAPLIHAWVSQVSAPGMPSAACDRLARSARAFLVDSLAVSIALRQVTDDLRELGLSAIALKGVRLAHRDYSEPRLRPMRDLDLLLPREHAEAAQAALLASGRYVPDTAEDYGVEAKHQLPALRQEATGVVIEIHHRLNADGWDAEPQLVSRMFAEAESLAIDGAAVRVPSAHANLLHIVEHATLHHLFDNGPVTLADLHFAAVRGEIDWSRLRDEAEALGLRQALQLVAALAKRHGASWTDAVLKGHGVPAAFLDAADAALLRRADARHAVGMLRRLDAGDGRPMGLGAALSAMVRPDPLALAQIAGCANTDPRRWIAYPVWIIRRGARFLRVRRDRSLLRERASEVALAAWLRGDGAAAG